MRPIRLPSFMSIVLNASRIRCTTVSTDGMPPWMLWTILKNIFPRSGSIENDPLLIVLFRRLSSRIKRVLASSGMSTIMTV